jgi:hypothetical protein
VCLQGASAVEKLLLQHPSERVRVFVVWEPVLPTDWGSPSTATLGRISDARAQQYWDKDRLLSKAMGEKDKSSIVWDWVGVYRGDSQWQEHPPKPLFSDGPIVDVLPGLKDAFDKTVKVD